MAELNSILLAEDNPKDVELTLTALAENHLANEVVLGQRRQCQLDVLRVVLGEQDTVQFGHFEPPSLPRQRKIECRASIDRSLRPGPSSVPLDDPPDVREPDPRSLELAGPVEALEHAEQLVR